MERIADGDNDENGDRLIEDLEKQMIEQAIKESSAGMEVAAGEQEKIMNK